MQVLMKQKKKKMLCSVGYHGVHYIHYVRKIMDFFFYEARCTQEDWIHNHTTFHKEP